MGGMSFYAVAQKSPCTCTLEHRPLLTQLIEWRLGLSQGSALHAEPFAMRSTALPFVSQVLRGRVAHRIASLRLCWGPRQEFPGAWAVQRALRAALVARGPQQAALRLAEAAVECVVGPRPARHVIAVEQARPRTPADRVEMPPKLIEGWRDRGQGQHRVERAVQLLRPLRSPRRLGGRGCSDVRAVAEPGGPLLACLGGLRNMAQSRPETAIQLSQARVRGRGQQVETATGPVLEALGGRHARQPHGRPACACEQGAGVAHEVRDALLGRGLRCGGARAGLLALREIGRARFLRTERTWNQAGSRQDAGWARSRMGWGTGDVAAVLAHGVAPLHLAGRLGRGQRLGPGAQRMAPPKLPRPVAEEPGPRRGPAR